MTTQKQKLVIFSRNNRPEIVKGEKNRKKSMTMPGQAVTVQEIIRGMTSGVSVPTHYSDQNLSDFDRLNTLEKIDFLKDLSTRNKSMKDNIDFKIAELQKKQKLEEFTKTREAIRQEVIAEMQKRDNKLNDDAK